MKTLTSEELQGVHGGVPCEMWRAMNKAWDLGLQVQGLHTGNHTVNSNHWRGRAMDIGGADTQLHKFFQWALGTNYREVIFKDKFYKNGRRIGGIGNHDRHVHYSF